MGFFDSLTDALGFTNHAGEEQRDAAVNAANAGAASAEEANKLYIEYMNKALAATQQNQGAALAAQQQALRSGLISQYGLAGAADLSYRQMMNAAQDQQSPYQTARISALQSLPVLQRMSGVKSYKVPSSVSTVDYTSGRPDYGAILKATLAELDSGAGDTSGGAYGYDPDALAKAIAGSFTNTTTGSSGAGQSGSSPQGGYGYGSASRVGDVFTRDGQTYMLTRSSAGTGGIGSGRSMDGPLVPVLISGSSGGSQTVSSIDEKKLADALRGIQSTGNKAMAKQTTGDSAIDYQALFGSPGTAGTSGALTTTDTPLEEFTPEYNYQDSPLYQFRQKMADQAMGRALRARGLYGSETGALIGAQEQNKISAEEAENQYNRVLNLVNLGMGGQATAGQVPTQAGSNLSSGLAGLSGDISGTLNNAANARAGIYQQSGQNTANLYQQFGQGVAENTGQIGQARATALAADYVPAGNNLFGTALKIYGATQGFGGGGGEFGYFGTPGSWSNPGY